MIKEHLDWLSSLLKSSNPFRKEIRKTVLKRFLGESKNENNNFSPEAIRNIHKAVNSSDFEFIGVTPNASYVKENASGRAAKALWVHPFAYPALLYKHKSSPILMIVSPAIRFNTSALVEVPEEAYEEFLKSGHKVKRPDNDVEGITG